MPVGSLWAELGLDIGPFKRGLGQSSQLSGAFSRKVAQDMRQAFFGALSPQRWFAGVSAGVVQAMGDITRATEKAQGAAIDLRMEDIPLDALTKMASLSERIGGSMSDMANLWKQNSEEAAKFRNLIENLAGSDPSNKFGDIARGWSILMQTLSEQVARGINWISRLGIGSMDLETMGGLQRAQENEIRRMLAQFTLAQARRRAAAMAGVESSTAGFSLGRPNQGGLAAIGGFTAGAGILAKVAAKTQTDLLKVIAVNTKVMADLARAEATVGGAP